jgi:hypothetical protein
LLEETIITSYVIEYYGPEYSTPIADPPPNGVIVPGYSMCVNAAASEAVSIESVSSNLLLH